MLILWKFSKQLQTVVCQLFIIFLVINARKHQLNLEKDVRKYFSVTTFGFLSNGRLEVKLNRLSYSSSHLGVFGWTLTKTVSDSITPYLESHQDKCLLLDDSLVGDGNIEIVSFLLDVKNNEMKVNCSKMFTSLEIRPVVEPNNITEEVPEHHHTARQIHHLDKQKRSISEQHIKSNSSLVANLSNNGRTKADNSAGKQNEAVPNDRKFNVIEEKKKQAEVTTTQEHKICSFSKIFFKKETTGQWINILDLKFVVSMKSVDSEGLYSLYFHNCANYGMLPTPVNLSISIIEQNGENFLSAGEIPLPHLYFLMSLVFFITGCIWICVLRRKKEETFKIHYLMGLLVFVKSFSLLFHGINFHIIAKDGSPMEAWAVLYYITHLLKGALLFITIVLIGTGWAFIKHILSDKDKKIFMIVIPLQVLANVAKIIMEESEEGESQHYTWREIFILVDLLCCGAILFPVVWSIRHLQEASQTDGKAAINLEKLKLFRHFYVMIVCYIYFTRIIVYLLKITVPFQYEWLDELFRETATLTFFILTGYNFRPTTSNPYFRLAQDDQLEVEEVITQTGFTEGISKTLRSRDFAGQGEENSTTKRESSHEYD